MCAYPLLLEFLKIRHSDPKLFLGNLKKYEKSILQSRNPEKPEFSDISCLEGKVCVSLDREAASFDIGTFQGQTDALNSSILASTDLIKDQASSLYSAYLRL